MNKRVVIVTYDMIPNCFAWGGCQRMYYLASYLTKNGYDVTVFSCHKDANNTFGNEISFDVFSITPKNNFIRNLAQSNWNQSISTKSNKKKINIIKYIKGTIKRIKVLKKFLIRVEHYLYNEPSRYVGLISRNWINTSSHEIMEYIKEFKVQNVIISAPPFGTFSISKMIKKKFKDRINLIFDYRDPWNLWKEGSIISRFLEKQYLQFADKIVFTNEYLALDMAETFSLPSEKCLVIANGYSEEVWSNINYMNLGNSEMVITYVGDISFTQDNTYRDAKILLKSFDKLIKENKRILLQFVGVSNIESDSVKEIKRHFGDSVKFVEFVDNEKALEYMVKSDVLLLLHTTNDKSSRYIVSGKMYDYIRANKPILSIGSENGIHCNMIRSFNLGIHTKNNEDSIFDSISDLYNLWLTSELNNYSNIKENEIFSREYQNAKYIELLK